jgi:hypothetical protein
MFGHAIEKKCIEEKRSLEKCHSKVLILIEKYYCKDLELLDTIAD